MYLTYQKTIVHFRAPSFILRSKVVQTHVWRNGLSTCVDKKYFSVDFFVVSLLYGHGVKRY